MNVYPFRDGLLNCRLEWIGCDAEHVHGHPVHEFVVGGLVSLGDFLCDTGGWFGGV